jgi:hypothetical protein
MFASSDQHNLLLPSAILTLAKKEDGDDCFGGSSAANEGLLLFRNVFSSMVGSKSNTKMHDEGPIKNELDGEQRMDLIMSDILEVETLFQEEDSMKYDGSSPFLSPTPIGTTGIQLVKTVSLSECLLLLQDRSSLLPLLKPFTKSDSDKATPYRRRPYQSPTDQWNERYQELVEYKKKHGHCNVTNPLSQWLKRQRYQYRLKQENRPSKLSDERQRLLDKLGFVWDSRGAFWDERFEELKLFHKAFGHCKVTKTHTQHRHLSIWLKRQRHLCRLYEAGDRECGMTLERVRKLLDLGLKLNSWRIN